VNIRLILCAAIIGATLSACSKANASGFDPSNPLHCAAQFEEYSIIARQQGDERTARGYGARSQWYAERARSLPAEQRTMEALTDLGNRVAAQPDGGAELAKKCWDQQDADPAFQRLVRKAKEAIAAGVPPSTSIHEVQ
jgi:hypothetical protein